MGQADPVTRKEAGAILGVSVTSVRGYIAAGRLLPLPGMSTARCHAATSSNSLEVYDWREHLHDPQSYWVTGKDAAAVLGVNRARLTELSRRAGSLRATPRRGPALPPPQTGNRREQPSFGALGTPALLIPEQGGRHRSSSHALSRPSRRCPPRSNVRLFRRPRYGPPEPNRPRHRRPPVCTRFGPLGPGIKVRDVGGFLPLPTVAPREGRALLSRGHSVFTLRRSWP